MLISTARRLTALVALATFVLGCGETVRVPLDLQSGASCDGDGFRGECARSVRVELTAQGQQPASDCVNVASGISGFGGLSDAIEGVSFPALSEGEVVTVRVSVFAMAGCSGSPFASGESAATSLGDVTSIAVSLSCSEPDFCAENVEFSTRVREIFGDENQDESIIVTVGHVDPGYIVSSTLDDQGDGLHTGTVGQRDGCVATSIASTFEGLAYVSCESATGQIGDDQLTFAATNNALREAVAENGFAVSGAILGRVENEGGAPRAGVSVAVAGEETEVLYFDSENGQFAANEGTFANGIFAVRASPPGELTLLAGGNTHEAFAVSGAVAASRLIVSGD